MDQRSQSLPATPPNEKLRPIKLEETIARGKYGAVWKATYKNEIVAVKIMPTQVHIVRCQSIMIDTGIFLR